MSVVCPHQQSVTSSHYAEAQSYVAFTKLDGGFPACYNWTVQGVRCRSGHQPIRLPRGGGLHGAEGGRRGGGDTRGRSGSRRDGAGVGRRCKGRWRRGGRGTLGAADGQFDSDLVFEYQTAHLNTEERRVSHKSLNQHGVKVHVDCVGACVCVWECFHLVH